MALNKLHVFNMTRFRKLLWMDADTLVLRNVDHLLHRPMFTASFTVDCCNPNSPAKPSGGLWVVEPGAAVAAALQALMDGPVPGDASGAGWHWGDMQIVRYLFSRPPDPAATQYLWPALEDARQGTVPGVAAYAPFDTMTPAARRDYVRSVAPGHEAAEGVLPGAWDGVHPPHIWHALDVTYDQCVGNCECMPERDSELCRGVCVAMRKERARTIIRAVISPAAPLFMPSRAPPAVPKAMHTIHFSCIQKLDKPSKYETEHDFMAAVSGFGLSCTRYYYMLWYEKLARALPGGLPAPKWTGKRIPIFDRAQDELVLHARLVQPPE